MAEVGQPPPQVMIVTLGQFVQADGGLSRDAPLADLLPDPLLCGFAHRRKESGPDPPASPCVRLVVASKYSSSMIESEDNAGEAKNLC